MNKKYRNDRKEERNLLRSLSDENRVLKAIIQDLKGTIAGAKCFLVFWDHGKYETKNSLRDSIDKAREILEKEDPNNKLIIEMFKHWKKIEDKKK